MARRRRSKVSDFLKTLVFLALLAVGSAWLAKQASEEISGHATFIDGDSLKLQSQEIRLWGIDAPEYNQMCARLDSEQLYPCGREAQKVLKRAAGGSELRCDGWERDKYDRLLAVCHAGDVELNELMVKSGWALAYGGYEGMEDFARQNKKGLWAGNFDEPSSWRRNNHESHSSNWLSKLKLW